MRFLECCGDGTFQQHLGQARHQTRVETAEVVTLEEVGRRPADVVVVPPRNSTTAPPFLRCRAASQPRHPARVVNLAGGHGTLGELAVACSRALRGLTSLRIAW